MLADTRLSHLGCGFSAVAGCPTVARGEEDTLDPLTRWWSWSWSEAAVFLVDCSLVEDISELLGLHS